MNELIERYVQVVSDYNRRMGQKEALEDRRTALEQKQVEVGENSKIYAQTRRLLELFVRGTEHKLQGYIEPVITEALEFVFDDDLQFHLVFAERRNQMEVDFILIRDADTEKNYQKYIQDAVKYEKQLTELVKESRNINFMYGGAVSQVISVIMAMVLVELLKIRGPIVFDEPSSAVGEVHSGRLGQLISSLSRRFNRQVIFITHSNELAAFADTKYLVVQNNKISTVTEESNQ